MRKAFLLLIIVLLLTPAAPAFGVQRGVYYEVFVRSFADGDGDGTGDFRGLAQKLDYLENLGVCGLWLMPVFPSPSYHGYDVTDYRAIDPEYGTMADFEAFLDAAHRCGMKVLLDIPFNHTSREHPWFLESQDPKTEKRDWYRWAGAARGSGWVFLSGAGYYFAHFGADMPDLNFDNLRVGEEIVSIARYWLDKGVDGFRLDAVSHIFAAGETGTFQDTARSADWWAAFYAAVKETHPDCYLLGEAWEPLDRRALLLKGLDSALNFDVGEDIIALLNSGGSGSLYVKGLEKIYAAYAKTKEDFIDAPFLTNHDQSRVYGMVGAKLDKAKMAASMLLTLPGDPIVYYGEEIGMMGSRPDEEKRTPMLWGSGDFLETSWRESRYNKNTKTVKQQESDPGSLLNHYKALIALRSAHPALLDGTLAAFDAGNPALASYTMEGGGETLLVLHNFSDREQAADLPLGGRAVYQSEQMMLGEKRVVMPPYSTLVLGEGKD